MTRLVVGAVIVDDGRAFVHRRAYDRSLFPGCWDIPGGHVDVGETPLDALGRELQEETGWRPRRVLAELGEVSWIGSDGEPRREIDYLVEVDGDLNAPRLERDPGDDRDDGGDHVRVDVPAAQPLLDRARACFGGADPFLEAP
jgi:8-oxo-dGTP diphosphatase